ncbi:hypothetical protein ACTJKC_15235 [Pedobacter sp. 22226]|uniref:hypothetical protein n=1 Tax=Pedobacter sp. 22226 TaxID=3453894 RepID=UPI003F87546C
MEENTVTLIVGLAGIIATLLVAVIGFYYTHKSQANSFREQLYSRQIDLISKLFHYHGRFKIFSTLIIENHFKEEALEDIRDILRDHSIAKEEAGAIFPTELYEQLRDVSDAMSIFMERQENDILLSREDQFVFNSADVKFALLSRSLLGVDELSIGNIQLTSSWKSFKRVKNIDGGYFDRFVRAKMDVDTNNT